MLTGVGESALIERMSDEWQRARLIRASEIGDYVYCNRQWWLKRVHGVRSAHVEQMQLGTRYHKNHANLVQRARRSEQLFYLFVVLAVAVFVYWLLAGG